MMKLNYLENSLNYLYNLANGLSIRDTLGSQGRPVSEEDIRYISELQEIYNLEQLVNKKTSIPEDELKAFFTAHGNRDACKANLLFMCSAIYRFSKVDETVEFLATAPDNYIWHSIAHELCVNNDAFDPLNSYEEFIRMITGDTITQEQTMMALDALVNRTDYIRRIGVLLKEVERALIALDDVIAPILHRFEHRFLVPQFLDEFQEAKLFDLSNVKKVTIEPLLFNANGLLVSGSDFFSDEDDVVPIVITLGVCAWDRIKLKQAAIACSPDTEKVSKLISDKTRLDILAYLLHNECYGQELSRVFGLTRSTIYKHMSALLDANLVKCRYTKKNIYYVVNKNVVKQYIEQLAHLLLGEKPSWE